MKKTLQTNIAMNDSLSYRPFTAMFVWSFFNFIKLFVCYYCYVCIFHWYFTRKCRDEFVVWWDI